MSAMSRAKAKVTCQDSTRAAASFGMERGIGMGVGGERDRTGAERGSEEVERDGGTGRRPSQSASLRVEMKSWSSGKKRNDLAW